MIDLYPSRLEDEPALLPRHDRVVHSDWHAGAPLSAEQAGQYEREGYVVLDSLFSEDEVAYLQRAAGALLADPDTLTAETIIAEPHSNEIRSIFEVHRQSEVIARLAADERLAAVARFLLGDEVYGRRAGYARQMLHAWKLGFVHPRTGERLGLVSPIPADFREAGADPGETP